jgi:asparagine synthase (glutamine-hydrolysing)
MRQALADLPLVQARWPHAQRVLPGPRDMGLERYALLAGSPGRLDRGQLLSSDVRRRLRAETETDDGWVPPDVSALDPFRQIQYFEMSLRLPAFVNRSLDRGIMAAGVEARVPFLDHELVELSLRIPSHLKIRAGREKFILRRAFWGRLPDDILWRSKRGLAGPINEWLRRPLPPFAEDLLSPRCLRDKGYFDADVVAQALARHRTTPGRGERGTVLNAVLGVQLWDELFRRDLSRLERAPDWLNNHLTSPVSDAGVHSPAQGSTAC